MAAKESKATMMMQTASVGLSTPCVFFQIPACRSARSCMATPMEPSVWTCPGDPCPPYPSLTRPSSSRTHQPFIPSSHILLTVGLTHPTPHTPGTPPPKIGLPMPHSPALCTPCPTPHPLSNLLHLTPIRPASHPASTVLPTWVVLVQRVYYRDGGGRLRCQ